MHIFTVIYLCILPLDIFTGIVYNINRTKESEVKKMPKFPNEYDYEESELEPTKPLSAKRQAEINELYAQMTADLQEINN